MKIKKIVARKILTSTDLPTIEVVINKRYSCSSPIGATAGTYAKPMYSEQEIDHSIELINNLKQLKGTKINDFEELQYLNNLGDEIGSNSLYALHGAILRALADNNVWKFLNSHPERFPIPMGNAVGGGLHGKNDVDFQEFLTIPNSKDFSENLFANDYIYNRLGNEFNIRTRNYVGAWAPDLSTTSILDILARNIEGASNSIGFDIRLGLNINANSFFHNGKYYYKNFSSTKKEKILTREEHIDFINSLINDYNIRYVQDPVHEDDIQGYKMIKSKVVAGDNIICTNIERLKELKENINAVIIKPNQIGSLTKLKEFIDYAKSNKILTIMSQRTGETRDDLISHLAIAWEIPFVKLGTFGRERLTKINTLKEIEKEIRG